MNSCRGLTWIALAAAAFAIACALPPTAHAQLSEEWLDYECSRQSLPDLPGGRFSAEAAKTDHSNFCLNYLRVIIETVAILHVQPPPFCLGEEGQDLYNVVRRYQTVAGIKPGMPMPVQQYSQLPATEHAIAVL
jgi:hypothetical protein